MSLSKQYQKHFIVARLGNKEDLYHYGVDQKGHFLNLSTLFGNLNYWFCVVGFVVHCIGFIAQVIFGNLLKLFNKGTRAP